MMASIRIEPHRPKGWPGAWPPRVFRKDVEEICLRELKEMNLLPDAPQPIRIERFIEKRFDIEVEPWDHGSNKHPGMTLFDSAGRPVAIVMNRQLDATDDLQAERRARSTMAHEAGHALLHGPFFRDEPIKRRSPRLAFYHPSENVFGDVPEAGDINSMWMEWQANAAIGGLLLPEHLVRVAVGEFLTDRGKLDMSRFQAAVQHLVAVFNVNASAVRVRLLRHLFPYNERSSLVTRRTARWKFEEARYEQARAAGIQSMWGFQRRLFEGPPRRRCSDDEQESAEERELQRYETYWLSKESEELEELELIEKRQRWLERAIRRSIPMPPQLELKL